MTDDLMRAVLAMDAYNRGYDQGLLLEPSGEYDIGKMSIIAQSDTLAGSFGVNIGFYAAAYQDKDQSNGEIIISFRGTDDLGEGVKDMVHGWPLAIGNTNSKQGQMAVSFLKGGDWARRRGFERRRHFPFPDRAFPRRWVGGLRGSPLSSRRRPVR